MDHFRGLMDNMLDTSSIDAMRDQLLETVIFMENDVYLRYLKELGWPLVMGIKGEDETRAPLEDTHKKFAEKNLSELMKTQVIESNQGNKSFDAKASYASDIPIVNLKYFRGIAEYDWWWKASLGIEMNLATAVKQIKSEEVVDYLAVQTMFPDQARGTFYLHPFTRYRKGERLISSDVRNLEPLKSRLAPKFGGVQFHYRFGIGGKVTHIANPTTDTEKHSGGAAAYLALGFDTVSKDQFYMDLEVFAHGNSVGSSIADTIDPQSDLGSSVFSYGMKGSLNLVDKFTGEAAIARAISSSDRKVLGQDAAIFSIKYTW